MVSSTIDVQPTDFQEIDQSIERLKKGKERLQKLPLAERIGLVEACIPRVEDSADEWVEAACSAKQIPAGDKARAEEILAGPMTTLRYLRLMENSLGSIEKFQHPTVPGRVRNVNGKLRVPVFPTKILFDSLLFGPLKAEVRLTTNDPQKIFNSDVDNVESTSASAAVALVLGAGNVSAIPATDALTKILQENRAVLVKMNPVNEYLGSIFERIFSPLIEADLLQIVYGGAEVGKFCVNHADIDEVHITGSNQSHDAIVWGPERRPDSKPILQKPITSELGNVTPWIIVPGEYSDSQLHFQAETIAASISNNASFNCIATKLILTSADWKQRDKFLDLLQATLDSIPKRFAYYPGAVDRYQRFSGNSQPVDDGKKLPWTLLRNVDPKSRPELFNEESFVCVTAEKPIRAESDVQFLERAVEFVNERVWGTLAVALTVPNKFQKKEELSLNEAIDKLRYGTVAINVWPGIAYGLMSPPWGGYPHSDLANVQSGIGHVHNTYMLANPEKTVLYSSITVKPKPVWFSTHSNPEEIAWKLLQLYSKPSLMKLPALLYKAIKG